MRRPVPRAQALTGSRRHASPCGQHDRAAAFRLSRSERPGPTPFGSFGLAIDRPRTRLSLRRGTRSRCRASSANAPRPISAPSWRASASPRPIVCISTRRSRRMPGSARARSLRSPSAPHSRRSKACRSTSPQIAARLERGARSGIGIATFEQGGAVLDGGPSDGCAAGGAWPRPLPARLARAADLRSGGDRRAGANEIAAFDALPDFPRRRSKLTGASCRRAAGARRGRLQDLRRRGRRFADAHGRLFRAAARRTLCERGRRSALGLASEASPASARAPGARPDFAFAASEAEGEALLAAARAHAGGARAQLRAAQGRNEGARSRRAQWRKSQASP